MMVLADADSCREIIKPITKFICIPICNPLLYPIRWNALLEEVGCEENIMISSNNKTFLLILILFSLSVFCIPAQVTGQWVAQKIEERDKGRDATQIMEMTLMDSKGRERHRSLTIIRKEFNGLDKLLLRFTYPNDIKGVSFLVWEHKGEDNERFLFLPALGRIRRIASSEKDENFAGTDFSYQDISGPKLEDYRYELVEDGVRYNSVDCYLLASFPRETKSRFSKVLSWVTKDSFFVIKAEYYNKMDRLEKTFDASQLSLIDGIWTALEISMENHKTRHRTKSILIQVDYNIGIPDENFQKNALERP